MNDLPDRFPRGWFVLGHQRDFPAGETKTIFGFNNKISIERNSDNKISVNIGGCLLYTSPSPRDGLLSRMPSSA